jgi:hypothetical protein
LQNAKDKGTISILPIRHIHLIVEEIGQDKANDVCSLYDVSLVPGFERNEPILREFRAYWEEGMCLAACYAAKQGIEFIVYERIGGKR